MKDIILSIKGFKHRYNGTYVLDIPDFAIYRGEVIALLGRNGAGKSTLLRMIDLLEDPTEGEISFGLAMGDLMARLELRRRMAMVFQEPILYSTTVWNNVALGLKFHGFSSKEIASRVERWLVRFGISDLARHSAHKISGGEAQRVCLARALCLEPSILLLDEPFSSLDPIVKKSLIEELKVILHESKITTIFVTQDPDEAFTLADRIAVMDKGRIIQVGSTPEVIEKPANDVVKGLINGNLCPSCRILGGISNNVNG